MKPEGKGSLYKREGSPMWWIKYYRHGRAFRESTKTTDENKAGKILNKRLAEIAEGNFMGPQLERTKIDELAEIVLAGLPNQWPQEHRRCGGSLEVPSKAVLWRYEGP